MSFYPHKPFAGQKIQGVVGTTPCDEAFIAHETIANAALGSTLTVHATITIGATAQDLAATLQPVVARNIVCTGNASTDEAIVITGKDVSGAVITETFTLSGTNAQTGTNAFKSVTNIHVPVVSAGSTVAIVYGNKLGLINKISGAGKLISLSDGTADAGTLATSATVLAANTYTPAATLNGALDFDIYYLV